MTRFAPRLMILFLCGTALAGCASSNTVSQATGGKTAAEQAQAEITDITKTLPTDLESGVRQAQLLRFAGHYDQAVKILSQMMMVASDDARVVGEYGKTLAEMGRAKDATQFLGRAVQLQSDDWTFYSALGVAYDQLGDQVSARSAYERALAIRPGEPSVLSNYSLSRMLANDPEGARKLIEMSSAAGGSADPKIARNIALVNRLAPAPAAPSTTQSLASAIEKATPAPQPQQIAVAPQPMAMPQTPQTAVPRPLQAPQPQVQQQAQGGVIMQRVPFDPLAGPVRPRAAAKPRPLAATPAPKVAAAAPKADTKPAAAKPVAAAKPAGKAPVKAAEAKKDNGVPALRMAAGAY